MRRIFAPALGLALLLSPAAAAAQDHGSMSVVGGILEYDLGGVGHSEIIGVRGTTSLSRMLVAEAGLSYFSYPGSAVEEVNHLLPELQLQVQWVRPGVRPYLGAGVGGSMAWISDAAEADLTVSTAGGVRWPLAPGWELQGELRVRAIDPWTGSTADWALGMVGRF